MAKAICIKCGNEKYAVLGACSNCGLSPRTEEEMKLSVALSTYFSTDQQLADYAGNLKRGFCWPVRHSLLVKAGAALKDPAFVTKCGGQPQNNGSGSTSQGSSSSPHARKTTMRKPDSRRRSRSLMETTLHRNPFWFLGATTRDNRRRIVELAEQKSLDGEHDQCQKARSDLTNPRNRLLVEMAWLPGVSPKKATQLVAQILQDPMSVREESGLPALAHANLLAAAFEAVDASDDAQDIAEFVKELASRVDDLSIEDIVRDINEDRTVSGFPEIMAAEQVEVELSERNRYYKTAIKEALNRLSSSALVEAMTTVVHDTTDGGEEHAPQLIDELVDSYELETQEFLQKEAENIQKLVKAVHDNAKSGERAVKPLIDKLDTVTRNWDKVAQPIQLSAKARGIEHGPSNQLGFTIRNLGIELCNEHDMIDQSRRITALLQDMFGEVPELAERVEQDAGALENIFHQRKKASEQKREWERGITYSADLGLVFKDRLSISPNGVSWKDKTYPLNSITRVRWGGVRHSVNGIPTGTTYTIAFGDNRSEAVLSPKEDVYSAFLDKLWRAVCIRLLTDMLEALKGGRELGFGEATLKDDSIILIRHKIFGPNETVYCPWSQVHIWSGGGAVYVGSQTDKKLSVGLSYINTPNAHILEQALRMAFKKPGLRKLSELLND